MGSSWQDMVIAGGQLVLVLSLWPMVRAREKPPFLTIILNVVVVYMFAFTFSTLLLWFAMASSVAGATVWLVLAIQKYRQRKK